MGLMPIFSLKLTEDGESLEDYNIGVKYVCSQSCIH